MVERALRSAAKYLYAINQSRAKLVLDPIYAGVAATLMKDAIPRSPRLMARRFPDNLYLDYRPRSRRLQYFVEDWDFGEARPALLTRRQRIMMHTVALGETSGSAVADGFLRAFRTEPELAAFFGTWFVEELNHFLGFHLYLEQMGERWAEERARAVAKVRFRPYAEDAFEVAACNMYQELVGFLVYRSFGRQARDPFLARMLAQFAKDELRHYKFYQSYVAREIQRDPRARRTVLKVFLKATSPYNQVSGGVRHVLDHLLHGVFYFRKPEYDYFLGQLDYLLGARFEPLFSSYFQGHLPPCQLCGQELYLCACARYEDEETDAAAPMTALSRAGREHGQGEGGLRYADVIAAMGRDRADARRAAHAAATH